MRKQDFLPTASIEIIQLRATLLQRMRGFFNERDFVEVTTPVLSADTVIDEHLDPLSTTLFRDPRQRDEGTTRYLQTSPEFHMKRLLAAGMERIFQIGPAFRGCESGSIHNTEFTMVEWYRVGDDMQAGMELLADLTKSFFAVDHVDRRSYADAFCKTYNNVHPLTATEEQLQALCGNARAGNEFDSRDDRLNFLWSHGVEPQLGLEQPVIIYDYPASQAALAKVRVDAKEDVKVGQQPEAYAERFELYFRGVELANGYHELTDAAELRTRNAKINGLRAETGKPRLPEESRLLAAMEAGLPGCAGVAMGFDRAVMVAAGKSRLDEVLPFPDANA